MPFEIDNVTKKLNSGKWLYYLHLVNLDQKILNLGARVKIRTGTRRYKDPIGRKYGAILQRDWKTSLHHRKNEQKCNKFVDHLIGTMMEARCKVVTHKD